MNDSCNEAKGGGLLRLLSDENFDNHIVRGAQLPTSDLISRTGRACGRPMIKGGSALGYRAIPGRARQLPRVTALERDAESVSSNSYTVQPTPPPGAAGVRRSPSTTENDVDSAQDER